MNRGQTLVLLVKELGTVLYALCCGIAIVVLSAGDYEWMIGEKEADGSVLTICTIPKALDDPSDVTKLVTLGMVAVLLAFGLGPLARRKQVRLPLVLAVGLLLLWGYCYWGRTLFCPG